MRDQVSGPIMPHGAVVVNACFDHAHGACIVEESARRPEFHYVAKHDLVFRDTRSNKRKRGAYNEPSLRVFSASNGMEKCRDKCSFIGVSNGTLTDSSAHAHAAVTIAGLKTIRNTGPCRVEPGDKIVWDVNPDSQSNCRRTFITKPYNDAFDHEASSHFEAVKIAIKNKNFEGAAGKCAKMAETAGIAEIFTGDKADELREFLKCYVLTTRELDSRVIGTAMSRADQDQEFDILLRHSH